MYLETESIMAIYLPLVGLESIDIDPLLFVLDLHIYNGGDNMCVVCFVII